MSKKPTIAISPVSHEYLTKGKEYEITFLGNINGDLGYHFHIRDDFNELVVTHENRSLHTDRLSWTLK